MTSVNKPTNIQEKEADVNRKLQLYGIASAFQAGKVPSNEQIDVALNSFLASKPLANPSNRLSPEGQALVKDFRSVVEQAKHLLLSKNQGNLLQDFIWESQKIDVANTALPGAPVGKDEAKQHGNEALEGLRTLGTLIISNGQFRKLLNDATILLRDIAGDAATNAASKVKPNQDQLSQIDRAADDNTWHDVPDLSTNTLKNQIKQTYSKKGPVQKEDLRDAAGDATQAAHPSGSRDPADAVALAGQDRSDGTASGLDANQGLREGAATLQERASANIPEETKQRGRETREKTKSYISKKMPEERREQTIWRLKKMVVECQGHPDYQQAITTLLDLAEQYAGHANTIGQQSTGTVKGAHTDSSLKKAENDLKTLIERFANGTSTEDLFESLNTIYRDADKDPELKSWFKNMNTYVRKCLKEQGYIMEDRAKEEWNVLYDRGNFLLRDRYRNHTDRIVDEIKFLGKEFDNDPLNKQFATSLQKLFNDLGNDENGKPTFKPHLLKDLSDVILPAVFEGIRYVPVPRIEYSDPMVDAIIENLVIESDNLMPNIFELESDHHFRWGRKNVANKNSNSVTLKVSGVQCDLRDVSYYINRKQGTPKLKDTGVADIFLGGSGFSFKMKMSTTSKSDKQNFFKIEKVDVDVKNFDIKLKQSRHKLIFKIFKPFMLKVLRPALQKALEKAIKQQAEELDSMLFEVKKEADRALQEAVEDPEQAPNIYSRYVSAIQKKMLQGKNKAEQVASQTKVNMAMTQKDSIFPDIHLEKGISSKATEYKELAIKDPTTWQTPVFGIGSAQPSSNLPKAPEITRKHHQVNTGGIRGPQNIGNTSSISNQAHNPTAQHSGMAASSGNMAGERSSTVTGFGSQVDQAFSDNSKVPMTGTNGAMNGHGMNGGSNGLNSHATDGKQPVIYNTTLGNENPVMTGRM
ncbi:hypothetical protein HYFRA_00003488 [Hymenoscyphus fraxineus]|uniref:Uncharacterized protein n=1 Tax=Hymenoscyphus fraxineus TaxID=746836 RepID=A0A9N9KUF6_9HELO|nr:hypothetical protein HYFRA_00003488 [Hymenoscyphus fraxineus]